MDFTCAVSFELFYFIITGKVKYCNLVFSLFEFWQAIVCSCLSSTILLFFSELFVHVFSSLFFISICKKKKHIYIKHFLIYHLFSIWLMMFAEFQNCSIFDTDILIVSHTPKWLSSINFMLRKIFLILGKYQSSLIFSSGFLLFY